MDTNLVREGYNKVAENYLSERDKFKNNKYLQMLVEHLRLGAKILDIGCGSGIPVDKYLADRGFEVSGIDISEKQIELAKKNIPNAEFEVKNMSDLQEGEYQVDAVISFYAIFHTPRGKHQELFQKVNSILPNGGYILVTMGAGEWEGTEDDFHGAKMWWSHYDAKRNIEIIKNAGFEILFDEVDTSEEERHLVILARKQ